MNVDPIRDADYYMNQLSLIQKQELQRLADLSTHMKPHDLLIQMVAKRGFDETAKELAVPQAKVYPKEAESLTKERPVQRKRILSLPPLNKLSKEISKDKAIEAKSGEVWECIDRTANKSQGYLYHFQVKKEYDRIDHPGKRFTADEAYLEKFNAIFPASEPNCYVPEFLRLDASLTLSDIRKLVIEEEALNLKDKLARDCDIIFSDCPKLSANPKTFVTALKKFIDLLNNHYDLHPTLQVWLINSVTDIKTIVLDEVDRLSEVQKSGGEADNSVPLLPLKYDELNYLGYRTYLNERGKRILVLPDREALLSNWNILKEDFYPDLPSLDIRSSEGIADDISFIEAYFTSDVLLSEGREFVHDQVSHLIPVLSMILSASGDTLTTAEAYKKIKWELVKEIMTAYKQVMLVERKIGGSENLNISNEQLEKFKVSIGALVDQITTKPDLNRVDREITLGIRRLVANLPAKVWSPTNVNAAWSEQFWKRRFNNEEFKIEELTKMWNQIRAFYPDLKKSNDNSE